MARRNGSNSTSSRSAPKIRLRDPWSPADLAGGGIPIVVAAFGDGQEFLRSLSATRARAGDLAVSTRVAMPPGTPVVLEVTWHGIPNRVFLRAWAHRATGMGLAVFRLDDDETGKRDFLIQVSRGAHGTLFKRKHRRFCVRLPVVWRPFGERRLVPGIAEDISAGGMLVATNERAAIGDQVAVRLHAEDADLVLTGKVRHVEPRARGDVVFGVAFVYRSSGEQRTLRQLLRTFAGQGVVLVY